MRIFGLPVFYCQSGHPDQTVQRQSGFLTPDIAYSNDRGMTVIAPYYHVLSPTSDVELQPTNFQFRGQGLKTIYRQRWDASELDTTIYAANLETFKKRRELVAATDTRFSTVLEDGWKIQMRHYRTTQHTFMRRYRYEAEQRLDSYVQAEKISDDRYYLVRRLIRKACAKQIRLIKSRSFCLISIMKKFPMGHANQTIRQELSALQLDNDEGHDMVRWTGLLARAISIRPMAIS